MPVPAAAVVHHFAPLRPGQIRGVPWTVQALIKARDFDDYDDAELVCIYPREAAQPMTESALLTGPLEPTNQWYAVAKIAGLMLCRAYRRQYGCDFISAMPTHLYGSGDTFDLQASHVVPALIAKAHAARRSAEAEIVVWGRGTPRREFMYVDDLADALVFLLRHYSGEEHINIGTGLDVSKTKITADQFGEIKPHGRREGSPANALVVFALEVPGYLNGRTPYG